jgi:hypothetical protein
MGEVAELSAEEEANLPPKLLEDGRHPIIASQSLNGPTRLAVRFYVGCIALAFISSKPGRAKNDLRRRRMTEHLCAHP